MSISMYLDKENEFSDAQAVTATAISENVIDLGATNTLKDIGAGEEVWLVVRTRTAATDAPSGATLAVSLEPDSTAHMATIRSASCRARVRQDVNPTVGAVLI